MAFVPFDIPSGIVKTDSRHASQGRWIDGDKVRFRRGKPEKVGGVQKLDPATFMGIARGAHAWNTFTGVQVLAFGTACRFHVYREGTIYTLTPYRADATAISLTNPFSTTNGSAIVTVADANHGIAAAGVIVSFSGASAVGGITISGDYAVTQVLDANAYTITHSSPAGSTAGPGGGSVTANYTLNCGNVDPDYLTGWGVGLWGVGSGWGTAASLASAIISEPRAWSLDAYGEDLLVNPQNGGLYVYDSGGTSRPARVTNSPENVRYAFVTPERYIFALGCTTLTGSQDNMTVRWPDIEDHTDWTPADTNTANQRKLQGGTRLIAGTGLTDGISIVWSDAAAFLFQFTGSGLVYDSRQIANHCGLIGPHAWTKGNGMAFWMGSGNLWMFAGAVQPIPNVEDVRAWVFDNVNTEHIFKSIAFYNPMFDEVWFIFPTAGSTEPNTYALVNLSDYSWSVGTFTRSAAAQYWTGETRPVLFGTDGTIYVHDTRDDTNNDGAAMAAHIELAPADIQGGNTLVDIFGFVPDFERQSGDLSVYLYGIDHPRDAIAMEETLTVTEDDVIVDSRIAGRQFGMILTSNTVGGDFRLGRWGLEISGAGSKRGSRPAS